MPFHSHPWDYGTLLVTSLIAAFTEDEASGAGDILVSVFPTIVVFWIAHVYADVLGRSVSAGRRVGGRDIGTSIRHEWPLLEAAIFPCLALALGAVGPLSDDAAFDLALAVGVVSMGVWSFVGCRALGLGRLATGATTAVSTALGLAIVALKVIVE